MKITSAKFVKSIGGTDPILDDPKPQIAVIGRSNVGKSSLINSLTGVKDLAITSSFPGRTQKINLFLVNSAFYLIDLPGYGFAKGSRKGNARLEEIIRWYLFESLYNQKAVILIIDAYVGLTDSDREMLHSLEDRQKKVIIVANKVDKIKSSEYVRKMRDIQSAVGDRLVVPYSSESRIGQSELADLLLQ